MNGRKEEFGKITDKLQHERGWNTAKPENRNRQVGRNINAVQQRKVTDGQPQICGANVGIVKLAQSEAKVDVWECGLF